MPPFDNYGNILDLSKPSFFIEKEDGKEFIFPSSIPEAVLTSCTDQDEHDCQPQLEAATTLALSDDFAKKLIETIVEVNEEWKKRVVTCFIQIAKDMQDKLIKAGLIVLPVHVEHNNKTREWRRAIRWDEKNRRRKLKGLPEKRNPYPWAVAFTHVVNLMPNRPIDCTFKVE